jgi:hypothetical protein
VTLADASKFNELGLESRLESSDACQATVNLFKVGKELQCGSGFKIEVVFG